VIGLSSTGRVARLRRSPLVGRITRYTAGSIVAVVASEIAFAACYAAGTGTTVASVLAFLAGAVPNWLLNRRWAWGRRGRVRFGREIVGYAVTSAVSLLASVEATGWASGAAHRLTASDALRVIIVSASYVATYGVLFVAKFLIYETVIFADDRDGSGVAHRSRAHVPTTTRANRTP
jgi:putative flippase GtrA